MAPLKPHMHHSTIVLRDSRRALNWSPIMLKNTSRSDRKRNFSQYERRSSMGNIFMTSWQRQNQLHQSQNSFWFARVDSFWIRLLIVKGFLKDRDFMIGKYLSWLNVLRCSRNWDGSYIRVIIMKLTDAWLWAVCNPNCEEKKLASLGTGGNN